MQHQCEKPKHRKKIFYNFCITYNTLQCLIPTPLEVLWLYKPKPAGLLTKIRKITDMLYILKILRGYF